MCNSKNEEKEYKQHKHISSRSSPSKSFFEMFKSKHFGQLILFVITATGVNSVTNMVSLIVLI